MDWIDEIQKALDYIEEHLTEEIDYGTIASMCCSSLYHFQRVFGILCGYTLGEYIRFRRLSLAGAELQKGDAKVIDVALKYGYDSPDSFARAFKSFHGVLPSQAYVHSVMLRSFSRLTLNSDHKGGSTMNYRIEEKPEMVFVGFKRRFTGVPGEQFEQSGAFFCETRVNQYLLHGMSGQRDVQYQIFSDIDEGGYTCHIAALLDDWWTENFARGLGYDEKANEFEKIVIPKHLYVVCETERMRYPVTEVDKVYKQIVGEWLPSTEYQLSDAPGINVLHWNYKQGDDTTNQSRYVELWLPIEKNLS